LACIFFFDYGLNFKFFFDNKGFSKHYHIQSGEDDLFRARTAEEAARARCELLEDALQRATAAHLALLAGSVVVN
jgi:hypothetical protein